MRDLTEGSIPRHLLRLAAPIAAGMIFQTLYSLIDLYFVARLGERRSPASARPPASSSWSSL